MSNFQKILDSFSVKDSLNPKIWENPKNPDEAVMIPKVRKALMLIAEKFIDYLGDEVFVEDILSAGLNYISAQVNPDGRVSIIHTAGGAIVMGNVTGTPLDDAGMVLVLISDESEARRIEAVRRDFVANVSHELKTPISAMGLLADSIIASKDASTNLPSFSIFKLNALKSALAAANSCLIFAESKLKLPLAASLVLCSSSGGISDF